MLPLATTTWDEEEYEALKRVIDSGMFSMGAYVEKFESQFAALVGAKHCVMVNSGSSANLLAVAALFYVRRNGLKPGDEVIVPAVSWATTYYPLHQYGLKIKFVDIDKETLNIDLSQLSAAITTETRAIFAVNLLGNPVDYDALNELLRDRNIIVIEDNCESLGATLNDRQAGTFGLMGTYSSFFSHHISTMEGGMVVTDNDELYHIMLSLRSHGWTRSLPATNMVCEKSDNPFEESFRFVLPGYNLRPLEMSGAVGIEQLKKLPSIIAGRRQNARIFCELFGAIPGVRIQKETGCSSWFGFALIVNKGKAARDRVVDALTHLGVDCRPIVAGNFVRNPVVAFFDYSVHGDLSESDEITTSGFFIGNHHYDISEELKQVSELVRGVLSGSAPENGS